jgi:Ca2+-binding EF-hand superfamily protein
MDSTKLTANELLAYQAISSFVSEANAVGGSTQKSLQLYNRLIQKTQISHTEAIKKHIVAFKKFCQDNQEALKEQEIDKITTKVIEYSSRVYINFRLLLINSKENASAIWQHIITIGAIVYPQAKLKKVLQEKQQRKELSKEAVFDGDSPEDDFLSNIMTKVESSVDPNTNDPSAALGQIMSGGLMSDLMGSMTSGMQDGSLDLGKLMGSLQKMVGKLQDTEDAPPEIRAMTGNLNQMLDTAKQQINNSK